MVPLFSIQSGQTHRTTEVIRPPWIRAPANKDVIGGPGAIGCGRRFRPPQSSRERDAGKQLSPRLILACLSNRELAFNHVLAFALRHVRDGGVVAVLRRIVPDFKAVSKLWHRHAVHAQPRLLGLDERGPIPMEPSMELFIGSRLDSLGQTST
jgi:hypothetical protein